MSQETHELATALLNSGFVALALVKDRHIAWANDLMHGIFGYEPDELIGEPTRRMFPDQASWESFGRELYVTLARAGRYRGTTLQKRKDGSLGWYEFSITPLASEPDKFVAAIVDRTSKYAAQAATEASGATEASWKIRPKSSAGFCRMGRLCSLTKSIAACSERHLRN